MLNHGLAAVPDGSSVGVEDEGVNLNSEGGDVLLFKLAGQMSFDESSFAGTAVSDQHQLEGGHVLLGFGHLDATISAKGKAKLKNPFHLDSVDFVIGFVSKMHTVNV